MNSPSVTMHWLAKETNQRLASYAGLVKEGKALDAALDFARFVLNSGLCDLLDQHHSDGQLPCDGRRTRKLATKLTQQITRRYEKLDTRPHLETADLEEIRGGIAAIKAKLGIEIPPVRLIEGGLRE